MELFQAHNQWATRPPDERFWTLQEGLDVCKSYMENSAELDRLNSDIEFGVENDAVIAQVARGDTYSMTHWAFGQMCNKVGAPANYMRKLSPSLVAKNLNYGLTKLPEAHMELLIQNNSVLRATTSTAYQRIWNAEVFQRLIEVSTKGWRPPPARPANHDPRARPATEEDVLAINNLPGQGLSVKVGDMIAPAGIYVSDRDMFVFLVNDKELVDDGTGHPLLKGVMVWNSEVGAHKIGALRFLCDTVCGNHIVWGAKDVIEWGYKHIGNKMVKKTWDSFYKTIDKYTGDTEDTSKSHSFIKQARQLGVGHNKEEVLSNLSGAARRWRLVELTDTLLEEAYNLAEKTPRYGDPRSLWAMINGLTEASQQSVYADNRTAIDEATGKLAQKILNM